MGKIPVQKRTLSHARRAPFVKRDENGEVVDLTSPANLIELKGEIMKNLQSSKPSAREYGAVLFANLLQANRRLFRDEALTESDIKRTHVGDIARTLTPLLLDAQSSVRVAAADALRFEQLRPVDTLSLASRKARF